MFQVMGMHFKLGLYEHQSAGALEGLITALVNNPELVSGLLGISWHFTRFRTCHILHYCIILYCYI